MDSDSNAQSALLEYARYYGLARRNSTENSDDIVFHVPPHGDIAAALHDPESPILLSPPGNWPWKERLRNPYREFKAFYESMVKTGGKTHAIPQEVGDTRPRASRLKLELPLLRTDDELDVIQARRTPLLPEIGKLSFERVPAIGRISFEPMPVDVEADEGLQWPQKCMALRQHWEQSCKKEELDVQQQDASWLRRMVKAEDATEEIRRLVSAEIPERHQVEPLTPLTTPPASPRANALPFPMNGEQLPQLVDSSSPPVCSKRNSNDFLMQQDALPMQVAVPDEMTGVMRKRRWEIDVDEEAPANTSAPPTKTLDHIRTASFIKLGPSLQPISASAKAAIQAKAAQHSPTNNHLILNTFSAADELERFMSLQSGRPQQKKKHKADHPQSSVNHLPTTPEPLSRSSEQSRHVQRPTIQPVNEQVNELSLVQQPTSPPPDLPKPDISRDRPVIISSSFLTSNRTLISTLANLHPNLILIEREFSSTAHTPMNASSTSKKAANNASTAYEGDVLISPSTSLLITTLQKVKQKPLPGQGQLSALRKFIVAAAGWCERLVVLISTEMQARTRIDNDEHQASAGMDDSDAFDLAELSNFCAMLYDSHDRRFAAIEILTIPSFPAPSTAAPFPDLTAASNSTPRPQITHLARWILTLIAIEDGNDGSTSPNSEHPTDPETEGQEQKYKLLPDTTTWESFLRRAGFNAFAAQVVLSELRAPDTSASGEGGGAAIAGTGAAGGDVVMSDDTAPDSDRSSAGNVLALSTEGESGRQKSIYGLPAFVLMAQEERVRRFGRLLGGTRMLERVGRTLDEAWRRHGE